MMQLHIVSYSAYIFGMFMFVAATSSNSYWVTKTSHVLVEVTFWFSELILAYIFNSMFSQVKQDQTEKKSLSLISSDNSKIFDKNASFGSLNSAELGAGYWN